MTNPNNIVQGKHLESLASDTRSYILAKDLEVIQAVQADLEEVQADLDNLAAQTDSAINELLINGLSGVGGTADVFTGATSLAGGASGLVPAPAAGDDEKFLRGDGIWALPTFTLGTISSTVEGAMWLED